MCGGHSHTLDTIAINMSLNECTRAWVLYHTIYASCSMYSAIRVAMGVIMCIVIAKGVAAAIRRGWDEGGRGCGSGL